MVISTLLVILGYDFYFIINTDQFEKNSHDMADITKLPLLIGVSIFSFESIGLRTFIFLNKKFLI
jgi:hypothetical protein